MQYRYTEDAPGGIPEWIREMVDANVGYFHWGPHEDYMGKEGGGWDSACFLGDWSEHWGLDDLNEVVNFYWSASRDSEECPACKVSPGYNPATAEIARAFYDFENHGDRWDSAITEDEVGALWKARRLHQFKTKPTAAEVNAASKSSPMVHDAINRCILIETRAKRLGVWGSCETCDGEGFVFTSPDWRLTLTLWMLHPRKCCSRGVEIASIQPEEIEEVRAYLKEATERNAARFAWALGGGAL